MTTVNPELKKEVYICVDKCLDLVKAYYHDHHSVGDIHKPKIMFTLRGKTAGTASNAGGEVNLNAILLNENKQHFIDNTVVHEMAHIFCSQMWGTELRGSKRISHGNSWKHMMRVLGADPKRCHSYDVTNSTVRVKAKYSYTCSGCQKVVHLGPTRHKRLLRNPDQYSHCRGYKLDFVGNKEVQKLTPKPVNIPKKVAKSTPKTGGNMTKMDKARLLFANNGHLSRKEMIELFIASADCTKAGASTYYQNIKRQLAS